MTHFLDIHQTDPAALSGIIDQAKAMKTARAGQPKGALDADRPLAGHMVALIFEKPSTRTRVSFDVGVRQMGGQTMVLSGTDMQLGHGETIADTARVLSRYVDLIMIRTFEEATLLEMAEYASVPVINGLTNRTHPCQIMADIMTFEEHRGPIKGKKVSLPALPMLPNSSTLTLSLQGQSRWTLNRRWRVYTQRSVIQMRPCKVPILLSPTLGCPCMIRNRPASGAITSCAAIR